MKLNDITKTRATLYMTICAVMWSTSGILIKSLPWNPVVIAGMRSLIAAGIYFLYMVFCEKTKFRPNRYSIAGGAFMAGNFLLFIAANKYTTAANAIVLQYSSPIFLLIISALLYRQKFRLMDILTVTATMAGISLFFLDKLSGGYLFGNLLALAAGLTAAFMFLSFGRADVSSRSNGILLGHLFSVIFSIPFLFLAPPSMTTSTVTALLLLGVFQLGIPYILYGLALRKCSPLACALISAMDPLLNPIWVFLGYGEIPGPFALAGGVIVIAAVVIWSIWSNKENK